MSEDKPEMVNNDRRLIFAHRYGHLPLPDVMNYNLCLQFRNAFSEIIDRTFPEHYSINDDDNNKMIAFWSRVAVEYQKLIPNLPYGSFQHNYPEKKKLLMSAVSEGPFWRVLSIIELVLRSGSNPESVQGHIRYLFYKGLAPYAVDDSAGPACIIPVDTPEAAAATVGALEDIHRCGAQAAHTNLRTAAGHINAGQYRDAVANSVHAVESIARDITGQKTLGPALDALGNQGLFDHPALKQAVSKLYAYASDTVRHGQSTEKAAATDPSRDEALLVFSTCAAVAGYLARKKSGLTRWRRLRKPC